MLKRCMLFLFFIFLISSTVYAVDDQAIKGLLDDFITANNAPGVSVAILKKGEIVPQTYSAGVMERGKDIPFTADTRIKIGSTTKVFTALRILKLIEDKKLKLTTPLSTFFPKYEHGSKITVENLLTHSSGVHEMLMVEPFHSRMDSSYTPQEIWAMVEPLDLDFEPTTTVHYSNTNFLLLGLIIEQVTGNSYNSEIQKYIMDPLGMTRAIPATDDLSMDGLAAGYQDDHLPQFKASLIPPQATGGIIASSTDLVKLVNAYQIFTGDPLHTNVRSVTLKNNCLGVFKVDAPGLQSEQGYGYGWEIDYYFEPSVRIIGKLGMFPGYCSGFYYWPDNKTAVAICTNQETTGVAVMNLAKIILTEHIE